jgi:hypothetical protein
MTFKNGLVDSLKVELDVFGEDAIFRNVPIRILRGTSTQTKNMRVAGFYKEESFDVVMLHPEEIFTNSKTIYYEGRHREFSDQFNASDDRPPQVNEVISFEGYDFRIREIEVLEYSHGFQLILEKII